MDKSCESCGGQGYTQNCELRSMEDSACKNWIRNPCRWLSIPPTEPGWYWWKETRKNKYPTPLNVFVDIDNELCVEYPKYQMKVKQLRGFWQGPITPKGE